MTRLATILYEDKMRRGSGGAFPPHDLVLAMIADLTGDRPYDLRSRIDNNPCNGVGKLIAELGRTDRLAGPGLLFVLVDRDRIAEHLRLPKRAPEAEVIARMHASSDAPEKLHVHFLEPNLEGLMRAIEGCDPSAPAPQTKDHNLRDVFLNRAAFSVAQAVRDCVKGRQPSLGALVVALAALAALVASA